MNKLIVGLALVVALGAPERAPAACAGDCGGDRIVTVNELILSVNIALGNAQPTQCAAVDADGNGQVAINELIAAVTSALNGCPFTGEFTGTADIGNDQIAVVQLQVAPTGEATGTMSVTAAAGAGLGGAAGSPLVTLTGTVNLDTGDFSVTGTLDDGEGDPVPVVASGTLPERTGASGALTVQIGPDSFPGTITTGSGTEPTPTPTATRPPPTPTATPTGDTGPTPEPGCEGGSFRAVFSNVQGTNANQPLEGPFNLTRVTGALVYVGGVPYSFGGNAINCGTALGQVIRRFQLGVFGNFITGLIVGHPYELGLGLGDSFFDYLETPTTNPLATIGWSAGSGTVVIDSISDTAVTFRIVDAHMVPEPSFSFGQPATGTFTLTVTGLLDIAAQ